MVRAFTNSWGRGGFTEYDAEFKSAQIQNSHLWGGGGGVGGTNFQLLMMSSNVQKKKKNFFWEKFSKFSDKKHNGFVLDFEYQVVRLYFV